MVRSKPANLGHFIYVILFPFRVSIQAAQSIARVSIHLRAAFKTSTSQIDTRLRGFAPARVSHPPAVHAGGAAEDGDG